MSRALVLGGGGPAGIGWEGGLLTGLRAAGADLGGADQIIGTSAGSVVGAALALGMDLADLLELVSKPLPLPGDGGVPSFDLLLAALADSALSDDPAAGRRRLGQLAVSTPTVDEDTYVSVFSSMKGVPWPERFAAVAVDVETGEMQVWDPSTDIPLDLAIASSCAVPTIFPTVTINGRRYIDGGANTDLNVGVAKGHDVVLAVSCFAPALPEGYTDPVFDAMAARQRAEIAALQEAGARVEVITPSQEFLDLSAWGLNLMDPATTRPSYEAGLRQAADEAERIRSLWS